VTDATDGCHLQYIAVEVQQEKFANKQIIILYLELEPCITFCIGLLLH